MVAKNHEQSATLLERLRIHRLALTCVCISSNNLHAFTASKDGSIIKWCLSSKKMLKKVDADKNKPLRQERHTKHINAIAISSDDIYLATGGWDKHIRIWSSSDLTWLHTFTLHRQEITALVFRNDHPTLYSASKDRSVMIWSLEDDDNRCFVEALYGHESPITSIDTLKRGRIVTSGGLDQSIRIWKIVEQAQTVLQSAHGFVDIVRVIDDKTFVSGGEDGSIAVWTIMKRTPLLVHHNAHRADKKALRKETNNSFSPDLSFWISSLATFSLKEKSGQTRKKRKLDDDQEFVEHDIDLSENDDNNEDIHQKDNDEDRPIAMIASGSCDSKLRLWYLTKNNGKFELKQIEAYDCPGFINDIKFTSDGSKILAACGQEHRLGRWWKLSKVKNCLRIFETNINK